MPEETRSMTFSPDEVTEVIAKAAGYPLEGTSIELIGHVQDFGDGEDGHGEGKYVLEKIVVRCTSKVKVGQQVIVEREDPAIAIVKEDGSGEGEGGEVPKNFETAICPYCRKEVELDLPIRATNSSPVWCPDCGKKDVLGKFRSLKNTASSEQKTVQSGLKGREELEKEHLKMQMDQLGLV